MTVGELVADVLEQLGPEERAAVRNVRLFCKPVPDAVDLGRGCYPEQQAAFFGVGREPGRQGAPTLPDPRPAEGEITLFLANLAPLTAERVRVAFLHELGHALGWDEETIHALGLHLDDDEGDQACCG